MAWYRCMGANGGGGSSTGVEEEIIKEQKISDTAGGGTYLYPTYPDLTQTNYEAVIVKIYMTKNNVYYERYISFALKDIPYRQSSINVYDGQGNAYALNLTIEFSATVVTYLQYSGSWETIYIDMYGVKQGSISTISKTALISETDFANLSTKEDDTLYEVYHNNFGTQIIERYQGSKRILNHKQDISEYEFWYEDVACIQQPRNKSSDTSEIVNTGITWDDFISHDWQIEFNATSMLNSSESAIIGSNTSGNLEIYFGSTNNLYIYGFGPDRAMTDCNGADIKITFNHTTKETNVYKNDVLIDTFTASASSSSSAYIQLFDYRDNYKFLGIVKYIGFKWL